MNILFGIFMTFLVIFIIGVLSILFWVFLKDVGIL